MNTGISTFIEKYKARTRFDDFDFLFPFMGIIYEIYYLDRIINFRPDNWTRRKSIEISLEKIDKFTNQSIFKK